MLPIPSRIIGWKQLLIPLAYIGVTVTLCYYFLIAFVQTERLSWDRKDYRRHPAYYRNIQSDSTPDYKDASTSVRNLVTVLSSNSEQRDRLSQVTKFPDSGDNLSNSNYGTRRGQPTQVRHRHQDSPPFINQTAPMHFPWPDDEACQHHSVRFANNGTFKPRALVSFPGSGNSWLRYLLEGSTGIFTGSIYLDRSLIKDGLLGEAREPNDGSTLVQKTHHNTIYYPVPSRRERAFVKLTELVFGYRGVLVIRNPYDALWSYWNFRNTRDHKGHAEPARFNIAYWEDFVKKGAKKWAALVESWVQNSLDYIIVIYEDLKADPRTQLTRIIQYLGLPVDEDRMNCVLKHIEGPFHRQKPKKNRTNRENMSFTKTNASHTDLDLIVKQSIKHVNQVFALYQIPIVLNYTLNLTKY